jgi:hypothetical protein
LKAARDWLSTPHGKERDERSFAPERLVHRYARWFGVDLRCTVKELQLLHVRIEPTYLAELMDRWREPIRPPTPGTPPSAASPPEGYGIDWDDDFAFIAGFTSGGAPFGVTWEEMEKLEQEERRQPSDEAGSSHRSGEDGDPSACRPRA